MIPYRPAEGGRESVGVDDGNEVELLGREYAVEIVHIVVHIIEIDEIHIVVGAVEESVLEQAGSVTKYRSWNSESVDRETMLAKSV